MYILEIKGGVPDYRFQCRTMIPVNWTIVEEWKRHKTFFLPLRFRIARFLAAMSVKRDMEASESISNLIPPKKKRRKLDFETNKIYMTKRDMFEADATQIMLSLLRFNPHWTVQLPTLEKRSQRQYTYEDFDEYPITRGWSAEEESE